MQFLQTDGVAFQIAVHPVFHGAAERLIQEIGNYEQDEDNEGTYAGAPSDPFRH